MMKGIQICEHLLVGLHYFADVQLMESLFPCQARNSADVLYSLCGHLQNNQYRSFTSSGHSVWTTYIWRNYIHLKRAREYLSYMVSPRTWRKLSSIFNMSWIWTHIDRNAERVWGHLAVLVHARLAHGDQQCDLILQFSISGFLYKLSNSNFIALEKCCKS